jgi:wyosine [tRNA(Phe)-imidazoG37] synthetase (radical SAM superfamily)
MQASLREGPGPGERRREKTIGRIVYPVVSRRSGGLSLGVDLFPDAKSCNFDCPYCEVFPREAFGARAAGPVRFSISGLEEELEEFLEYGYERDWAPEPVRDICFSGSGEPTSSPDLERALLFCASARRKHPEVLGSCSIVVITNSTGFLDPAISGVLERASREEGLVVWAKLDGGNEETFRLMSGTKIDLERITEGILDFSKRTNIVVQTMLCEVDGRSPTDGDIGDYGDLISHLLDRGARVDELHLYTFARPTPVHSCAPLSEDRLRHCATVIRDRTGLRVRAFGLSSELCVPGAESSELLAPGAEGAEPSPVEPKPAGLRQVNPEGIDR